MTEQQGALQVSLYGFVTLPISAVAPWLLGRYPRPAVLITAMSLCYAGSYLGLLLAPTTATWLWSVLAGVGSGAFPAALTLIALRGRTPAGTLALSAFAQSFGYLVASTGPVLFGLLHDWTSGWQWPLIALCVVVAVHQLFGLRAARPRYVEDDLTAVR